MLKEARITEDYETMITSIINDLQSKGFEDIKADLPDFETPAKLVRQKDQQTYIPDITAVRNGKKYYFEISQKTAEESKVVDKWKLLALLSNLKNGAFKLFVPHGSMRFTTELLRKHNIVANVVKI